MAKILIPGSVLPPDKNAVLESDYNVIHTSYQVHHTRGVPASNEINIEDEDIVHLEFDDGGEWIGPSQDIKEVFGPLPTTRGGLDEIPLYLRSTQSTRGIKEFAVKLIHLIKAKKKLSATITKNLGQLADQKIMHAPGLYRVNHHGSLEKNVWDKKPGKYLLFLHGTLSSFDGSFGDLYTNDNSGILRSIEEQYGDRVITYQHHTLSLSPFENAQALLDTLPEGIQLDIISHSRGGLIADILSACDLRGAKEDIYSKEEITLATKEDPRLGESLRLLNKTAKQKKIIVERVIRIACPANGTELLSSNLDHYLNGVLATVGKISPIYPIIKGLITDIIRARLTPGVLPGILSMVPESYQQKLINHPQRIVKNQLIVLEGDADVGKRLWHSVLVILSNLFYRKANDFVVNTDSMRYGTVRESGLYFYLSKDNNTSHFNYFKNATSQKALNEAIRTPFDQPIKYFEYRAANERQRGVIVDLFKKLKAISVQDISGDRPVIILIPGVMGTHLSVAGKIIWADFGEIGKGRIVRDLAADNLAVETNYLIGDFYEKMITHLKKDYDVYTFGFDWRLSLSKAADHLIKVFEFLKTKVPGQSVSIIAHSMGGLVVRDTMRLFAKAWKEHTTFFNTKTILLGTPWCGSHLIMEVFTGHQSRVRQLNFLDTNHSRNELIAVFNRYPGLYDLLPVNEEKIETPEFWSAINAALEDDKILIPPLLAYFKSYKSDILRFNQQVDLQNVYYLAGHDDKTTCSYQIQNSWFGKKLKYLATARGDGSVTWELGIPKKLPPARIYYAHDTSHGDLANDTRLFKGLVELIERGETNEFKKEAPIIAPQIRSLMDHPVYEDLSPADLAGVSNQVDEAEQILLGKQIKEILTDEVPDTPISVRVIHGDLRIASYPVVVGHFEQDGITNAEAAIDKYYDYKLTERLKIGRYPEGVGDTLILFDPLKSPKGIVVAGLGNVADFTAFHLRKTIESAVLNYAMYFRDNFIHPDMEEDGRVPYKTSLSCLCIGTGYGKLSMQESLAAILQGVHKANQIIDGLLNLQKIDTIEFIEKYEHIAQHAYYQLNLLEDKTHETNLVIRMDKGIVTKPGARRKFQFSTENSWWHNFTTRISANEKGIQPHLHFTSASGAARVEEQNTYTSQKTVQLLLKQLSKESTWDHQYSKTIFEILIPNAFKEIIRNQNNILWKMDLAAAAFPWEMFHDYEFDKTPSFVRSGLVRQLFMDHTQRSLRDITRSDTALVIGDPDYTGSDLNQLEGARQEAVLVNKLLKQSNFNSIELIHKPSHEILKNVYNASYKILHISGHGLVSDDINQTGVALGDGLFITPAMINNLSRIPEFVFINCCWSGTLDAGKEKWHEDRHQFAANIGTELIKLGVQAIVVAGWPVDDTAAFDFAKELYTQLLNGTTFGEATKAARMTIWNKHRDRSNTWGAYQCYGDQWYRLTTLSAASTKSRDYFTTDQIHADLYNLKADLKGVEAGSEEANKIKKELIQIIKRTKNANLYVGSVIEAEASIYADLNEIDPALKKYEDLRKLNKAEYSIKSIEQYYNLKVKKLVTAFEQAPAVDIPKLTKELSTLMQEIENLLLIGTTAERLSIIASAYKRFALIRDKYVSDKKTNLPTVLQLLETSKAYYQQAFEWFSEDQWASAIYPLANWLIIESLTKSGNDSIRLHGKKDIIKKQLVRIEKEIAKDLPQQGNYYEINALNYLYQTKLWYAGTTELTALKNKIIHQYKTHWEISGSAKNKQSRREQLEFYKLILKMRLGAYPGKEKKVWGKKMGEVVAAMEVG